MHKIFCFGDKFKYGQMLKKKTPYSYTCFALELYHFCTVPYFYYIYSECQKIFWILLGRM